MIPVKTPKTSKRHLNKATSATHRKSPAHSQAQAWPYTWLRLSATEVFFLGQQMAAAIAAAVALLLLSLWAPVDRDVYRVALFFLSAISISCLMINSSFPGRGDKHLLILQDFIYIYILYYIILYYIILYYIILYYIILYYIILYYIILYHIISYHIISYHIISYHIISYHIISYHIISYHIISYHIISYHIILYYIRLDYIIL